MEKSPMVKKENMMNIQVEVGTMLQHRDVVLDMKKVGDSPSKALPK